jgi:hypothetical protein
VYHARCFFIWISAYASRKCSRRSAQCRAITRSCSARRVAGESSSNASLNTHGRPRAPRPIITEPHPVSAIIRRASAIEQTSPLPVTGTPTASTTSAMIAHGALPVKRCERLRGCTVTASTPSASAIRATSAAVRC